MMKTPNPPIWLLLSWLLLSLGLCLYLAFHPGKRIASESISIPLTADRALVGLLYTPRSQPSPHPIMMLGHGVNNSKANVAPLAMELARHGIATLTFDFGGFGESYPLSTAEKSIESLETSTLEDAQAVLAWIRDRPERFDLTRIGMGGHSMGGTTALQLGQIDSQLRATVVLSMTGMATPTAPRNLFLGVGAFEQMNSPSNARLAMESAIDSQEATCLTGGICGDFATGTARQLVVSATADHIFAPYDGRLTSAVVHWVARSFAIESDPVSLALGRWMLGWELMFAGGIGVGVWGVEQFDRSFHRSRWRRLWQYGNPAFWSMVAIALWAYFHRQWADTAANLLLFCYILQLASNYALQDREKFPKALRIIGLYALLFQCAALLPAGICGLPELWRQPLYLLDVPQFIGQWLLWSGYVCTQWVKHGFFPAHTLELRLSALFVFLVLWEFVRPGTTFGAIERVTRFGVQWLRRPFQITMGSVSSGQVAGLSVLVGVLVVLLHQRATDGLLGLLQSQGGLVVRQLILLLSIPLVAIVGGLRSPWFRRWEVAAIEGRSPNRPTL
jgi:dienelactone hydrolase